MPFIWSNPEGGSFSSMTIDDLTVNNSIDWGSAEANKLVIDTTDEEAFLVRKDSDGGDVFVVDTNNSNVNIPAGANLVLAKGSTTQGRLQFGESGAHYIMRYDTIVGASRFSNALVLQDEVPNTYMAFDSASQDVEFTDGDVYIGSGSLLVDTIQSTSADGTISFTDQNTTLFELDGSTNVMRMPNGRNLAFGDANNYWLVYDNGNTQLELNSTDIDGGGTNGLIFVIPDGEQKFQIAASSEIEYLGTGSDDFRISTPSNNIFLQAGNRVRLISTNLQVQDGQFVGFGDSEDYFIRFDNANSVFEMVNATGVAENFLEVDASSNVTLPNGDLIIDGGKITRTSGNLDINAPGTMRLQNGGANKLNISGSTITFLDKTVNQATTNGSGEIIETAEVNTTDATPTTVYTVSTASDTSYKIRAEIVASETVDHDETAVYEIVWALKNDGGTLTEVGETRVVEHEDTAGWDVDGNISTTDFQIQVTGAASTDVNWHAVIKEISVS